MGFPIEEVPISWINRTFDMGHSSFHVIRVGGGYLSVLWGAFLARNFGVGRYRARLKGPSQAGAPGGLFGLDEQAGEALGAGLGGAFARGDVSGPESVEAGFARLRARNGQERVMMNCAGIAPAAKTVSKGVAHDPAVFLKTLQVNLFGSFNCASQSALGMVSAEPLDADGERGVVISTTSVAAFEGQVGQVASSASKGGIVGMTLPMARDLSRDGVRVCTIAPGIFRTPLLAGLPEGVQDSLAAQVPLPSRLGDPPEVAALPRHLLETTIVTCVALQVDVAVP